MSNALILWLTHGAATVLGLLLGVGLANRSHAEERSRRPRSYAPTAQDYDEHSSE